MASLKNFINRHQKAIKIISALSLPAAAIALIIYMKFFYEPGHGIACFTYKYFGIYCMGCGSTRQLYCALNGQFEKAFYYNVACVIIYPVFIFLYYLILRWAIKDKKMNYKHAYVLAAAAMLLVIYMILRNIPAGIFDVIRPLD